MRPAPDERIANPLDLDQRAQLRRHLTEVLDRESTADARERREHENPATRSSAPRRAAAGGSLDEVRRAIGELEQPQIASASLRAITRLLGTPTSGSPTLSACARLIKAAVEPTNGSEAGHGGESLALREHGWVVREFTYRPSPLDRPPFSYTVGLSDRWGHPELACVAIDHSIARGILSELAGQVSAGRTIRTGDPQEQSERAFGFEVRAITAASELLRAIVGLTGSQAQPPALQIVVKDGHGRVPPEQLQSLHASAQDVNRSTAWRRGILRARGSRARRR
jgi:hypothetical protein